jgi:hypothetical protein
MGIELQLGRRHAAVPLAILRSQGGHGLARGSLCSRAGTLGHRDDDRRSGRLHQGYQPFAHSGRPADEARLAEYEAGPYAGFGEQVQKAFAAIVPDDADPAPVADKIVEVVDTPFGKRPFRVHYDPTQDGADVGFTVLDRLRAEMLHRVGLSDLLKPRKLV